MNWYLVALGIYFVGFALVLWFNIMLGMIELPLCLLRALVWPIYVTTGWPYGYPSRMD